ncbi:hypothetical protein Lser_V15G36295 [Lactuca serriola]
MGNDTTKIQETKTYLDKKFSIKYLGSLKYFLGIEVANTSSGMVLSQRKCTLDILKDNGMMGYKPSSFPIKQNLQLDQCADSPNIEASQFQRLVGRLLYLHATRPDIAYVVNLLNQFVSNLRQKHMDVAMCLLHYLKETLGQGILLPKDGGTKLVAYCDSDWLGCAFTRRSQTRYLILLGGAPISCKTKKQTVVSRSFTEAMYRAIAHAVSKVLWLRWLLKILKVAPTKAISLFCDNQATRYIANNPVFHEQIKHVEMDCFFVEERVETQEIRPVFINAKEQLADVFTNVLRAIRLKDLLVKLGTCNLYAPT